jgi:hypothetical protein
MFEIDLKKMEVNAWKEKMRDEQWRLVVEETNGCSAYWQPDSMSVYFTSSRLANLEFLKMDI